MDCWSISHALPGKFARRQLWLCLRPALAVHAATLPGRLAHQRRLRFRSAHSRQTAIRADTQYVVQRIHARGITDPFRELGVEPSASESQIKKAYRKLALR
jgi:DnaJ-domain-containing protein 1